tara:strand:- start:10 stop:186 length:177 start_codon:yes stop_codon:yes gene_type:complete
MGFEDEMQEYHDEVFREKHYYELRVPSGIYSSDNIFSLMWELFSHRLHHLIKHGRWMD